MRRTNSVKLLTLILLLFSCFYPAYIYSQKTSDSLLVGELGSFNCSEYAKNSLDNFFVALQNQPDKKGIIVLYGEKDNQGKILAFKRNVINRSKLLSFDMSRVKIIFGKPQKVARVQFWITSEGSQLLKKIETFEKSTLSSPIRFDEGYADLSKDSKTVETIRYDESAETCDLGLNFEDFAAEFFENFEFTGYLVIYNSPSKFLKISEILTEKLNQKYKVPKFRIKTIYGGRKSEPQIELWFVPIGTRLLRPELIDEFGNTPCGDILARIDNLFISLQNKPESIGYVVTYGDENKKLSILYREMLIKGQIRYRGLYKNRIKFIRGEKESEIRNELWIVPKGTNPPNFKKAKYTFKLSDSTKPFKFADENYLGYCPAAGYEKAFFEVLFSNPKARGNLVIYAKSQKEYLKRKEDLLQKLSKISAKRLRFFYVKEDYLSVEYWIVPKRKRK